MKKNVFFCVLFLFISLFFCCNFYGANNFVDKNVGTGRDLSTGDQPVAPTNDVGADPRVCPEQGNVLLHYIDQLYTKRLIDLDQASLYKVYALVKPEKLPNYLKDFNPPFMICATPIIDEIYRNAHLLSPMVMEEINFLLLPDLDDDDVLLDSDKYPIRIHFPKNIEQLTFYDCDHYLSDAEKAYEVEINEWGFIPPPPDGGFGGNDFYDIFIRDFDFLGGYTLSLSMYYGVDWYSMTSCCVVGIDPFFFIEAVAHESNHSCQFAADALECSLIMEASATYIGEVIANGSMVNSSFYLQFFQALPHKSLDYYDNKSVYEYGASLFMAFLCEYYDEGNPVFVRKIWEGSRQRGAINEPDFMDSIAALIVEYKGDSFDDTYREFAQWRYFTSINDDGKHFKDGFLWDWNTIVKIEKKVTIWDLPLKQFHPANAPAEYGANYIEFDLENMDGSLFLDFKGNSLKSWSADMILFPVEGYDTQYAEMEMMNKSDGILFIPDVGSYWNMVLVISNLSDGDHDPDNRDWAPSGYTLNGELIKEPKAVLYMNQFKYSTDDSLKARLAILNPGDEIDVDVVTALSIGDALYFYPAWSPKFNKIEMKLEAKSSKILDILDIDKIPESIGGIYTFFAALIDPATGELIGEISRTNFSVNLLIPGVGNGE